MSGPIVLDELDRIEVEWADMGEQGVGLIVRQTDRISGDEDSLWIPKSHVKAFVSAIQKIAGKNEA